VARARRTRLQRLVIAVNLLLVAACLATAAALGYTYARVREIPRVVLDTALAPAEREGAALSRAENFLIVGTDSAEGLDPDDPVLAGRPPGIRSDTIMLLHVDPDETTAALLSLPRDLWVPIAGQDRSQRINMAINEGGPQLLIDTIAATFGVDVHHYVEVDFAGFYDLVEAIDGVPVYFPEPARDPDSLLDVPEAGCVTLDASQALAYARSRHYEVFRDGRWHTDGSGDLGRITRQQDFIRRALHRAVSRGARNPAVLKELIDVAVGTVTVDDELTPGDLLALGSRFRSFNPDTLATYSLPVDDVVVRGAAVLRVRERDAEPVLAVFRGETAAAPGGSDDDAATSTTAESTSTTETTGTVNGTSSGDPAEVSC
jgi:polyisoprenyl-teichoic acid--peptidoglycan teichoic acid transferase